MFGNHRQPDVAKSQIEMHDFIDALMKKNHPGILVDRKFLFD